MPDPRRNDSPEAPPIEKDAFERILLHAVIRPAGRRFRGEPARQTEILRFLREAGRPVPYDAIHRHLRARGVLRSARDDDAAQRKAIAQAVEAINAKLGAYFFHATDPALQEEMFRIRAHEAPGAPTAYALQDFFAVRKLSGVRSYAATTEPSGGLTQEIYEIVTRIRPPRFDMMAPALDSFFGNPEFRGMLTSLLREDGDDDTPRVRVLILDPDTPAAARLERQEQSESPHLGALRDRIRATLAHAVDILGALPPAARPRLAVRVAAEAPLWRFRMIFLPDALHLRLTAPAGAGETLIRLASTSALSTSLRDVFETQWTASGEGDSGRPPARRN